MLDFANINFLAVAVAGAAAFILGSLWYSPLLFSKAWQKAVKLTEDDIKGTNMGVTFGTSFLLFLFMNLTLAFFIQGYGLVDWFWMEGAFIGLIVGLGFVGTTLGINYLYQKQSFKLWLIDASYQILALCISGAILGAWQ